MTHISPHIFHPSSASAIAIFPSAIICLHSCWILGQRIRPAISDRSPGWRTLAEPWPENRLVTIHSWDNMCWAPTKTTKPTTKPGDYMCRNGNFWWSHLFRWSSLLEKSDRKAGNLVSILGREAAPFSHRSMAPRAAKGPSNSWPCWSQGTQWPSPAPQSQCPDSHPSWHGEAAKLRWELVYQKWCSNFWAAGCWDVGGTMGHHKFRQTHCRQLNANLQTSDQDSFRVQARHWSQLLRVWRVVVAYSHLTWSNEVTTPNLAIAFNII